MSKKSPQLRFEGFTDDWEERKVKDIFKITRGQVLAATETSEEKSDISPFPVYSSQTKNNGLMGYYKDYLFDTAITWTTDGANAGTVSYRSGRFYSTNVNGVLISDKGYTNKAISEILNLEAWKWVSHVGNPKLMNNVMGDISIMIPSSFEEQDRLSDFLNQLDDTIALHQRKLDLLKEQKKGYLQKMFPKNGAKVPELRFAGFADDWEERKLGELSNIMGGGTPSTSNTEYWDGYIDWYAPAEIGEQSYVSKSKKTITELGLKKSSARILPIGTVLFTSRAGIGNTAILAKEATTNQGFQSIVPDQNKLDSYFIFSRTNELKRYGEATGAGSTFVEVSGKQMSKMPIMVPELSEQKLVGSFFKQLDNTITRHQRKLELLKDLKKGYLQKMFPKNGAKVPELRFAGFADDWEERKLSSMTNYKNGKSHEDKQSTSGKLELINLNSISISGGLKHSGKFIDEADDTLQKDDLVMILSDVGHGDLLGRVALIPEDDRFVLNQRVALLRPNTTADPQFLFSYINAHQYYFKAQGAGMSQLNISKGSVENFISFVPIIEEQKKIGAFFKQIDDTIALHQCKLDLLKEQKKGFLQKMFV